MDYLNSPSQFSGWIFDPSLSKDKLPGEIYLSSGQIHFRGKNGEKSFSLSKARISRGGAQKRIIFIRISGQAEVTLSTADQQFLKSPELQDHPQLQIQVKGISTAKRITLSLFTGFVLVSILAIYGLYLLKEPLVQMAAQQIPVEWEIALGKSAWQEIEAQNEFIDSPELQKQLEVIANRILNEIDSKYNFEFYIIKENQINAFALPGGKVAINSGLIEQAEDPSEVAGVLAHEIAHVTQQHSVRQLINTVGLFILIQFLLGDASGLIDIFATAGVGLAMQSHSRDYEREADKVGMQYLKAARIDGKGLVKFFEVIRKEQEAILGETETALMTYLSTHPNPKERIENTQALLKEYGFDQMEPVPLNVDLAKMKLLIATYSSGSSALD